MDVKITRVLLKGFISQVKAGRGLALFYDNKYCHDLVNPFVRGIVLHSHRGSWIALICTSWFHIFGIMVRYKWHQSNISGLFSGTAIVVFVFL